MNGKDKAGMAGIGLNLLPEPGDMNVDGAANGHGIVSPNAIQ
jgi:hypothetical protein